MHKIQATALADIVNYIEDKIGEEPTLGSVLENTAGEIEVDLHFTIRRSYPGMESNRNRSSLE